ncbi:MAG: hypothetical protein LBT65_06540 [Synergistaceae bacterium]|nr:hypothetical protein [Synergistaceae bacterium]
MISQNQERQELHRLIDTLSDADVEKLIPWIIFLQGKPNDGTIEAIEELRSGGGRKFHKIEDLMADLRHTANGEGSAQ